MPFIPHTEDDLRHMLEVIGAPDIDALFDEIPEPLRIAALDAVPPGLGEMEVMQLMQSRAHGDGRPLCFIGAGAYEHHIPAAVWAIASRGEFYSAYTPYQAEASQGTLQSIYEYQTMLASLTGMEVCNASMYEGATALAEAVLMAVRINRRSHSARVLLPRGLHPHYRAVVRSMVLNQGVRLEELPFDADTGQTPAAALARLAGEDITAVVIGQPNFFGVLEDVDALADEAHALGAAVIALVNPTSLALLRPPGQWGARGANIVVGDGQPLGCPLSGGGPYFGFLCTRMEHVRQMPGRVVGRTLDIDGRAGFTLTLQAREQHIRRAKATSNICTNQGLLMLAGTVYLALLGPAGLERVAGLCMQRTAQLAEALCGVPGIRRRFASPVFHEIVLMLDRPVPPVLEALESRGIQGGLDLGTYYPELGHALLACATEMRSPADIETYARCMGTLLAKAA